MPFVVQVGRRMDTREDTDGLVEVEDGPGECPREQSALAKTREWRVWLRNGWVLRETLAIFKIAAPMVSMYHGDNRVSP